MRITECLLFMGKNTKIKNIAATENLNMLMTLELRNKLDTEFSTESDRGCAILSLCLLEESLVVVFSALLPGGMADARHFMPKGRLSAGISNARKLGLINNSLESSFKILVEIRNKFAHGILDGVTFQTESIKAKVSKLALPNLEAVPDVLEKINSDPRQRFMMAVDNIFFSLNDIKNQIQRLPQLQPAIFSLNRIRQSS